MPMTYLALLSGGEGGPVVHLVRENAEASLCGLPRASLSTSGTIDDATVCRECIDWTAKRWTGTFQVPQEP